MRKFNTTFKLTYLSKIKSKAFVIFTAIVILLMVLGANANKIIDLFDKGPEHIGIVAQDKHISEAVTQALKGEKDTKFEKINEKDAKKRVESDDLQKAYVIDVSKEGQVHGKVIAQETVSDTEKQKLQMVLTQIQTQMVAKALNVSQDDLKQLQATAKVDTEKVTQTGHAKTDEDESGEALNSLIATLSMVLMLFIVITYANQVAMEIATEKTSRVVEMVITSVKPTTHIMAKIAGVLGVAMTQIGVFVIAAVACIYIFDIKDLLQQLDIHFTQSNVRILLLGIVFIILGVLSYVLLAALLGALTSRIEDLGQAMMPLTLLMTIAFYIAIFSTSAPNTLLTKITSYIPFLSPFVMYLRATSPDVSNIEIAIGIGISIVTIICSAWLTARCYKNAVLTFEKGLIKSIKRVFKKA